MRKSLIQKQLFVPFTRYYSIRATKQTLCQTKLSLPITNFDDKAILKAKSLSELIRTYVVLQSCQYSFFVENCGKMYDTSCKILGNKFTNLVLQKTFFGHFCGGEDEHQTLELMKDLESKKIGSILAYAVEGDISNDNQSQTDSELAKEQERYDKTLQACILCVETAAKRPNGFVAVKLTGLTNPNLLLKLSNNITKLRDIYPKLINFSQTKKESNYLYLLKNCEYSKSRVLYGNLSFDDFKNSLKNFGLFNGNENEMRVFFDDIAKSTNANEIDYIKWIEYFQPTHLDCDIFFRTNNIKLSSSSSLSLSTLSKQDIYQYNLLISRLNKISELGDKYKVRILMDAEHTYFQPAIDYIVIHLQKKWNNNFPVILNTYQAYLKSTFHRVIIDMERAKREGFIFGAKVVRGAYMALERDHAKKTNVEDPIHDTKENTDANYNKVIDTIMQSKNKYSLVVASHNEQSVIFATQKIKEYNLQTNGQIFFGQLLGMCDHITYTLSSNGYSVLKYVLFGPISEVVPYLVRRAQENSAVVKNSLKERSLLSAEIRRRIFPFL